MEIIKDAYIEKDQCVFVNLMSAKGRESFYEKSGFEIRPNDNLGAGMSQWLKKD